MKQDVNPVFSPAQDMAAYTREMAVQINRHLQYEVHLMQTVEAQYPEVEQGQVICYEDGVEQPYVLSSRLLNRQRRMQSHLQELTANILQAGDYAQMGTHLLKSMRASFHDVQLDGYDEPMHAMIVNMAWEGAKKAYEAAPPHERRAARQVIRDVEEYAQVLSMAAQSAKSLLHKHQQREGIATEEFADTPFQYACHDYMRTLSPEQMEYELTPELRDEFKAHSLKIVEALIEPYREALPYALTLEMLAFPLIGAATMLTQERQRAKAVRPPAPVQLPRVESANDHEGLTPGVVPAHEATPRRFGARLDPKKQPVAANDAQSDGRYHDRVNAMMAEVFLAHPDAAIEPREMLAAARDFTALLNPPQKQR